MKRNDSRLLAGLILLVIGAAVLAYGIIGYNNARASLGGAIQRIFNGTSSEEQTAVLEMICGAAVAVVGFILILTRRVRRR
jgi:hypothetical protein